MNAPNLENDRRRDLERELRGVLPEFEIVDRRLVVRDDLSIDWIGFDAHGELVVVLWSPGESGQVVLDLIDAIAFVRSHLEVLARHWRIPEPSAESAAERGPGAVEPIDDTANTPVRAVCLAEHFEPEVLERLSVWGGTRLDLFEVQTLRSERGEGAYLVPVRRLLADPVAAPEKASFFDDVAEEAHGLAHVFMDRMSRVDERVEFVERAGAADWYYDGDLLGALRVRETQLEASLPGIVTPFRLYGEGDVDAFLERVLARLVDLTDGEQVPAPTPQDGSHDADFEDALDEFSELPEFDDGDDLAQIELIPMDSGPLLTREEIEAFHD